MQGEEMLVLGGVKNVRCSYVCITTNASATCELGPCLPARMTKMVAFKTL
jgi:hypothetical protein